MPNNKAVLEPIQQKSKANVDAKYGLTDNDAGTTVDLNIRSESTGSGLLDDNKLQAKVKWKDTSISTDGTSQSISLRVSTSSSVTLKISNVGMYDVHDLSIQTNTSSSWTLESFNRNISLIAVGGSTEVVIPINATSTHGTSNLELTVIGNFATIKRTVSIEVRRYLTQDELNSVSWTDLKSVASVAKSNPEEFYSMVGMTKVANDVTWRIVDVGHKFPNDGTAYGFTFMAAKRISSSYMTSSEATGLSYVNSTVRSNIRNKSYSELDGVIEKVQVNCNSSARNLSSIGGGWGANKNSILSGESFFLPCIYEIFGDTSNVEYYQNRFNDYTYAEEGYQFKFFEDESNRLLVYGSDQYCEHWLRSLAEWPEKFSDFGTVQSSGSLSGRSSHGLNNGVLPCFCI